MDETTSTCGHRNRPGARYCSACGAPVLIACRTCGTEPRPGARFCDACGTSLSASSGAPAAEGERKQITVLFADVARSMDLAERFDPDEWTEIITGLFTIGAEAVERFGGTVDKFTGDGLMALFGAPTAQEDHAARAAHAALALTRAATEYAAKVRAEHGAELTVRVGLNSGEVVAGAVGESGFTAVGHTVGLAQRMESLAEPGTVWLSEHTARLLGTGFTLIDLGPTTVKGATEPVRVHRLEAAPTASRRRGGSATMVGRDAEWATLLAALDAADAGHAQVIGIVGEAGAGKSRLTDELARHAAERGIGVRRTAGVSHATNIPLLPIRALFADYFGVSDTDSADELRAKVASRTLDLDPGLVDDLPLIFDFLEVPDPARPAPQLGPETRRRRVLDLVRRLARSRSERTSFVFLIEDLHWFDEQSVTFLDEWLPSFPGTRTLIVTNFRPEFRAPWASRSYYRQIPLPALDPGAVRAMLAELLGTDPSVRAPTEDLADRAGGNPFFLEEIVRAWVEDGTLIGARGEYTLARPVEAVRVPPTVQGVLAGRIDRLDSRSKAVLQAAAVIGRAFTLPVLAAVVATGEDELRAPLRELCAAELLQEVTVTEFRFWHPLTQEVAYSSLLNATRRRHHQATAHALLATGPDRHDELAALVASHFEAADDHLETARWQVRAASRASRTDVQDAVRRLRVAVEQVGLAPVEPTAAAVGVRAQSLLLRVASRAGLGAEEAEAHVVEARRAAEALHDQVALTHLAMATAIFRFFTGSHASARDAFGDARRYADTTGDRDLQVWTRGVGSAAHATVGPLGEGLALIADARALGGAEPAAGMARTGSRPELALPGRAEINDTLHLIGAMIELSAGHLDAARIGLVAARESFRLRPVSDWLVWTLTLHATLADCSGLASDADLARDLLDDAHRVADEAGSSLAKVKAHQATAVVALIGGRPAEAETALARALALARARRAGLFEEAALLVNLTRAHLALGEFDRARAVGEEAATTARRQGARVVESSAHLIRTRVLRISARDSRDVAAARAAATECSALAAAVGAGTWLAFLAEERTRLDGGHLGPVAEAYTAIGATGHAARIRAELNPADQT